MTKKKIVVVFLWGIGGCIQSYAQSLLDFLDVSTVIHLKDFTKFVDLTHEYEESFCEYYDNFLKKYCKCKDTKKKEIKKCITNRALNNLEITHSDWFSELQKFKYSILIPHNPKLFVERNAKMFLMRYGILDEFYQRQVRSVSSFWSRLKGYSNHIKTTWLSS